MSSTAIILTLSGYIGLLFIVAWLAARNNNGRVVSFFTGGRNTPQVVAAIAMVGAAMSGVTYISVPGTVAADSFSYLQTTLGFFFGYVIISKVLIPIYYRMGVVSLYEYLDQRFDITAHRTGAWLFFVAKIASASLRAYVICVVLQGLLFDRYGIPFEINATLMMFLVWLYTRRGGVRSVVWVEALKTVLMVGSIVACIAFVIKAMGMSFGESLDAISRSDYSQILFFSDPLDRRYFWKQFISGIFLVVAMTGLDQDMMQTSLSCRNMREAQRSMMTSIAIQIVVIALFLILGALLYLFIESRDLSIARGDDLFGFVATECGLPAIVGILFLLGLVASTYSSAGSALTALTTSFMLDILNGSKRHDITSSEGATRMEHERKCVHLLIAIVMTVVIICFERWSTAGVITLIFTMASYTYGPLLGMFTFGVSCKRSVRGRYIPIISILSPAMCYIVVSHSAEWFAGYQFSYEVLILNALLTIAGMWICSYRKQ